MFKNVHSKQWFPPWFIAGLPLGGGPWDALQSPKPPLTATRPSATLPEVFAVRQRVAGYAAEGNYMTHSQGAPEQGKGDSQRTGGGPYFTKWVVPCVVLALVGGFFVLRVQRSSEDADRLALLTGNMTTTDVRQILGEPTWSGKLSVPRSGLGYPDGSSINVERTRWVYKRPFGLRSVTVYFDEAGHFNSYWYSDWFD
jgi:hypothetical protein